MAKRTEKEELETEETSSADASLDEESQAEESDDSEERDAEESESDASESEESESDESESEESESEESESEESESEEAEEKPGLAARRRVDAATDAAEEGEDEEIVLPTQLGTQRYVFAAYLTGGMLMAYVLGRAIHGIWAHYANRDFFVSALPQLAAVSDEGKQTYATILAGLVTLIVLVRTYRKPDVKQWTEEVTSEMTKVKWPSRKEVTSATIVVIAASAIATAYLFLLDRLWAFVTGLVYGAGT